jgi:predicted acetyltransferase
LLYILFSVFFILKYSGDRNMQLVWPSHDTLPSYILALERGWSPNNLRQQAGLEELAMIEADPSAFVASLVDREGKGAPVPLPDGSLVPRLPGFRRWIWDGEFCGTISLRWQHGTNTLPPYCLGHIGYAVVPWKQRQGYATQALALLLRDAPAEGLTYVHITTEPENIASQRVIRANGGELVEEFTSLPELGGMAVLRFRIVL